MVRVRILEEGETLSRALGRLQGELVPFRLLPPEEETRRPHLLCVAPGAGGRVLPASCGTLLLPGSLSPLARQIQADCAVSYGDCPKDTLTFSWAEEGGVGVSLQRELVTLDRGTVERQELAFPGQTPSLLLLAWVGLQLLLGVPPEKAVPLPRPQR